MVKLFESKDNCCGCGSCVNICPQKAISMVEDEYGYLYPSVNESLCIECGLCTKVCRFKGAEELNAPKDAYAAVNIDKNQVMNSSSGGIFVAAARYIIQNGGIVYGAAYRNENGIISVEHIGVDNTDDLYKLQGSKYVQSNTGNIYQETKKMLESGRLVLFSGTPCQVSALKGFLRKDYKTLFIIDIICHGVPNQKLLNDYLQNTIVKSGETIEKIDFRSKNKGWDDYQFKYWLTNQNAKTRCFLAPCYTSSYYSMFLKGEIYRDSCYRCKYAGKNRTGDITLGDFWGVRNQHPELFSEMKWKERRYEGISCALINTRQGEKLIGKISDCLEMVKSDYERVSAQNGQLVHPVSMPDSRSEILDIYVKEGYAGLEKRFRDKSGISYYYLLLKNKFPLKLKLFIKRLTHTL